MRKRIKRALALLASAAMLMTGFTGVTTAAEKTGEENRMPELDTTKECDLTIKVTYSYTNDPNVDDVKVSGAKVAIVKVADVAWSGGSVDYTLDKSVADTDVDFTKLTESERAAAASKIRLALKSDAPVKEQVSDAEGNATFTGLPQGMYLVYLEEPAMNDEGVIVFFDDFLIGVPYAQVNYPNGENQWLYSNALRPKPDVFDPNTTGNGAGEITVTKRYFTHVTDLNDNTETTTAQYTDQTFYFGLFRNAGGTQDYSDLYGDNCIKAVTFKEGFTYGSATWTNLKKGTYYVLECSADGKTIYAPGTTITYDDSSDTMTVSLGVPDGAESTEVTNALKLDPKNGIKTAEVIYDNTYNTSISANPYDDGEIDVQKQVVKNNSTVKATNRTFYVGVFTKDGDNYTLVRNTELKQNDTVQVTGLPFGGEDGKQPITYYVFETDKDGNMVDKDTFEFEVKGEGPVKIEHGKPGSITLTNTVKDDKDVPTTPDTTHSTTTRTTSVQTGDETPIELFVGLAAGAFIILILVVILMRRRRAR